ncbi:MAG: hypothetical protein EBE86_015990 [Hormoscilla sp. GUM202]|nr:hypothetical protein [Hormoscilla sp. GUM202]
MKNGIWVDGWEDRNNLSCYLTQVATYKNSDLSDSHFWQIYPQKCHFGVNHKALKANFG